MTESIKIWDDAWIPSTVTRRIFSPKPAMEFGESVANLIAHNKAEWNGDLVRSIFLPREGETILSILISSMNPTDSQVWAKTPNGIFSVKSAYKVAVRHLEVLKGIEGRPGCFNTSKMETIWKLIWSLKCPNKVKHFLWCACKNALPTKQCLMHRKVVKEDKCDLCGECESSGHILWGCKVTKETWSETSFKLDRLDRPPKDFLNVVWLLMASSGEKDWEKFAVTAWLLWNNRNSVRFGGKCKNGKTFEGEARNYVEDFRAACLTECQKAQPAPRVKHWTPPPQGMYKVNVDVVVFMEQRCCGIGVVIRNDKGQMMGALCKKVVVPWGALKAEAKAAKTSILLAWDLGLNDIVVEGDSQLVMFALKGFVNPASVIQKVVEGSQWCLSHFKTWRVEHIKRNNYGAAYLLARNALYVDDCVKWVEDTPPVIELQIQNDVIAMDFGPYQWILVICWQSKKKKKKKSLLLNNNNNKILFLVDLI